MSNDQGSLPPEEEHFNLAGRLHTDVLEDKYGPIHAEVIRHDDKMRESHLRDEQGTSRTYALTFFPEHPANDEIKEIDEEIRQGGLIGKVFRNHSYSIRKNVIGVRTIRLSEHLKSAFDVKTNFAKARLSEFYARKKNSSAIIYGRVVEIYTPDFRPAVVGKEDIIQVNPTTEAFEAAGITSDKIWEGLEHGNDWGTMQDKYDKAKEISLAQVYDLNTKIDDYVSDHA